MYWEICLDSRNTIAASLFTRNRFLNVSEYLHLVGNNNNLNRGDKFSKVNPLLRMMNESCLENFIPEKNISIDESMVPYYGRHCCKQNIQTNQFFCYNKTMGGVDRMDQNIGTYMINIRNKKWWWPIFPFGVDLAVNNAFQLCSLQPLDFNMKIKLNGKRLYPTDSVKYLGVKTDSKLNLKNHVNATASKLNRTNAMPYKVNDFVIANILKSIYYALFESHVNYPCIKWGQNISTINRLYILQKRVLKTINLKSVMLTSLLCFITIKLTKLLIKSRFRTAFL